MGVIIGFVIAGLFAAFLGTILFNVCDSILQWFRGRRAKRIQHTNGV
jgi:hypothetical protein